MSSEKVSMTLDDIIKKDRKGNNQRGKKGGVAKKGKIIKKALGNKQRKGGPKPATKATERLVQQLVKKALAQNSGNGRKGNKNQQNRIVRQAVRNTTKFRGVNRRSQIIKKGPRNTETVVIKKIVQQRPQPRQQVIREVIVQEPVRQRFVTQPARRFNNNRPKVVYVEKHSPQRSFGNSFQQRPRFQQQRPRFQQQRRNMDPFYEPANYLQRL